MGNVNKAWIIVAIFIITGFVTSIQFKQEQTSQDIITIRSLYEEQKSLDNVQAEVDRLNESIMELSDKLESYYSEDHDADKIIDNLKNELEWNRTLVGGKETQGPGVRIHMEDSLQYAEGQNENNYIIHNSDILQIINDLRGAGAERIAINGVPITWNSEIDCNGATIRVGDKIFAPPFIIEAIGDPERLESALVAPDGIIQLMKFWDIRIFINKQKNISIREMMHDHEYKYLKIVEEEGDK